MLSRKAKYALKALLVLAEHPPGEPVLISRIAKRERMPQKFLELILLDLKNHGLLQSRKGPRGGYSLGKLPSEIRLGTVVRIMDGPLAPVPCVSETAYHRCEECVDEATCGVRMLMQNVRNSTAQILDGTTLADLAARVELSRALAPAPRMGRRAAAAALTPERAAIAQHGKHAAMIVHKAAPFNGGPPLELLRREFFTPEALFFVRNHGGVPRVEERGFRLTVEGLVGKPRQFSMAELRKFAKVSQTATMMCAGIRRSEFDSIRPIPGEVPWGAEPVSNAAWAGVRLADVLDAAGVAPEARHVQFEGLDEVERDEEKFFFGGSVPLEKAAGQEVLLAFEMNGKPLLAVHGAPLRAVVPGYIGARSVKWLSRITLRHEPSSNYFQTRAYKLFPPNIRSDTVNWAHGVMLGEQFTNLAVCRPSRADLAGLNGHVKLEGYALGGAGRRIERVEISTDDGATWVEARISQQDNPWAWCFWEAGVVLGPASRRILARAWDGHDIQPQEAAGIWNFKGYMNNSWFVLDLPQRPAAD